MISRGSKRPMPPNPASHLTAARPAVSMGDTSLTGGGK
jgi:hypothetical protein